VVDLLPLSLRYHPWDRLLLRCGSVESVGNRGSRPVASLPESGELISYLVNAS